MTIPDRGPLAAPDLSLTPAMIDASKPLMGAFDHMETEVSAGWIVRFMRERGAWTPFTYEEIAAFYHRTRPAGEAFRFNRLVEPGTAFYIQRGSVPEGGGWIVLKDGRYHVTRDFVERCYKASPKRGTA